MLPTITSVLLLAGLANAYVCRPLANTYPPPSNSSSTSISTASNRLNATLKSFLSNQTVAAAYNTTTFSLDVFSSHSSNSQFTYHYVAPAAALSPESVKQVNSNTVYRVGSVSKAWTVYIWLLAAGDTAFNDPITKYVPEIAEYAAKNPATDNVNVVDWESITIGALASQLSGISRDPAAGRQGDALYQAFFGLPAPSHEAPDSSFCGESSAALKFYCNRSDFFSNNLLRGPNSAPFVTPIYANLPYQILAYALENITNTPFTDLFQTYLVERHNLKSTFFTVPTSTNASIIPGNQTTSFYNVDFAESSPFGGYFSSLNDISTIARAILNSTFLTPAMTRRWLKPSSFSPPGPLFSTDGVVQAVGAPWEITRAPAIRAPLVQSSSSNNTAAQRYQTWIYTKTGDIGAYSSIFALIPEFNAGFTILSAGPAAHALVTNLADLITESFIPSYFETARQEAQQLYTGSFSDESTNSSAVISVSDAANEDQSVLLEKLIFNGTDYVARIGTALYRLPQGTRPVVRLYPTGLESITNASSGEVETEQGWKASFSAPSQAQGAAGAFTSGCWSWAMVGGTNYGGVPFDDMRFQVVTNKDGARRVIGFGVPLLQVNMTKAQ